MRIFAISDLGWWRKTEEDVYELILLDYLKIKIRKVQPDLILMGGDLLNDSSQTAYRELIKLLKFINILEITCFLVEGNHDNVFYHKVLEEIEKLEYIQDISERIVEFEGLKILGLPYPVVNDLKKLRNIIKKTQQEIDIILTHANLSRRIFLFKFNVNLIVTGHYNLFCRKVAL